MQTTEAPPALSRLVDAASEVWGAAPHVEYWFAPGRVNLIGEHIDYLGGTVMPLAISRGIYAAVRPLAEDTLRIRSLDFTGQLEVSIPALYAAKPNSQLAWANYALGVWQTLRRAGFALRGADIILSSDLPDGSGLSSSAALEVLAALVAQAEPDALPRAQLAQLCQRAEHEFVGVHCGIMDQYAVACAEPDELLHLDCQTVRHTGVLWNLPQHTLVVLDSRAPRTLAASAYNQRRQECDEAAALLRQRGFSGPLAQAPMGLLADALGHAPVLLARARHAVSEQLRVRHALRALSLGDAVVLGELLEASHHSLRVDYEVTGPELDAMVAAALGQPGCLGARMTGAGFGGCAIALVETDAVPDFIKATQEAYQAATGIVPELFPVRPTAGARRLR